MIMLKASIVIPTYQRCKSVKRLLEAFNNQTFPPADFEVIVSIDGSSDGTKEMVEDFVAPYKLRYIWEPNSGRASACNRGIHEAKGDVLIILDDDMEPCTGFVQAHYALHTNSQKLAVLGAAPTVVDKSSSPIVRYMGNKFNAHLKTISQPGYNIRIWEFYSGNFSIRRELLIDLGLYNETFTIYGHEDVELANRFPKNGIKILFSNEALAAQHYEKELYSVAKDNISEGKTAVHMVNLYPETFSEIRLREYNATGWKWRSLRLFLIWSTMLIPGVNDLVIFFVNQFKTYNPSIQNKLCHLALDYSFWLGVWTALRNDKNRKELISKIKSYNRT